MTSVEKQMKEAVNWKREEQKLLNSNNREKTEFENEWILRDLWDYNKIFNSPGGEEKQGMPEELLKEIIAEDFLNLVEDKPTDSRS